MLIIFVTSQTFLLPGLLCAWCFSLVLLGCYTSHFRDLKLPILRNESFFFPASTVLSTFSPSASASPSSSGSLIVIEVVHSLVTKLLIPLVSPCCVINSHMSNMRGQGEFTLRIEYTDNSQVKILCNRQCSSPFPHLRVVATTDVALLTSITKFLVLPEAKPHV